VTEGTTRLLETPERSAPPAQEFPTERPGELAQATNRLPPQGAPTTRGLEVNRKPTNWVLISALVVAAIALISVGIVIGLRNRPAPRTTPVVVGPGLPPVQPPPPPGLPPAPPAAGVTEGTISPALIYPGAKTVMQITGGDEGHVIQLQTSDSFDKVVSWYTEKLKPTQIIRHEGQDAGLPGGKSVILPSEETTVVIGDQGGATSILLTKGEH
jgi:hypothetical protein